MSDSIINSKCVKALKLLAEGDLIDWSGLPEDCRREHAETAIGPSEHGPDGVANFKYESVVFRDYPPSVFAPFGITVWWKDNVIYAIQVNEPHLDKQLLAALGEPDKTAKSKLHPVGKQLIFARRGLTLHIVKDPFQVIRLYGYSPKTTDEYLATPFGSVEVTRTLRKKR